jgi:type II secretory ATPase GspE/PulE/Tfp pilus assembly ATPase PilB-like protein
MMTSWGRKASTRSALAEPLPRFDVSAAVNLENADDLARLNPAFVCSLSTVFGLDDLAGRFLPVLLDNNTVAIFALDDQVGSDQVDALASEIIARGMILATPSRYVLSAPLLLGVARGQVTARSIVAGVPVHVSASKPALAEAFQDLVSWALTNQATDIHLNVRFDQPESEVKYTVAGRYVAPERFARMPTSTLVDMLAVAWMDVRGGNGAVFDPTIEQQGSITRHVSGRTIVLRWSSLAAEAGPAVCLRVLQQQLGEDLPSLCDLGYMPDQIQLIQRAMYSEGGAVVFAGSVGSGKSTSLASLIASLPTERKVVTLEDPVEYVIPGAIQNSLSRNLDVDAHHLYGSKLRALKRSGMNDVLLGEIRDVETGRAFMDLAGSGVAVFTTVHAPSVHHIAERLASDFIQVSRDFLCLPGVFRLRVFQALFPRLCQECRLPVRTIVQGSPSLSHAWRAPGWLDTLSQLYSRDASAMCVRNPEGCVQCRRPDVPSMNGYAGREVVAELIEADLGLHNQLGAMDCAVLKAYQGLLDPRDVETRFRAFETERLMRSRAALPANQPTASTSCGVAYAHV